MRQRGVVPSSELIPLQFRMPPEFVKAFKQAALDNDMKLNELLKACFDEFMKNENSPSFIRSRISGRSGVSVVMEPFLP